MEDSYPKWMYSVNGARKFNSPDEHGEGWYDSPVIVPKKDSKPSSEDLDKVAAEAEARVNTQGMDRKKGK